MGFSLRMGFGKKIGADHFFRLKMEQEQAVYCLLEGRDVFAVMPTGIACRWNSK